MEIMFLCSDKNAVYRAYTREQIGETPVRTFEEVKAEFASGTSDAPCASGVTGESDASSASGAAGANYANSASSATCASGAPSASGASSASCVEAVFSTWGMPRLTEAEIAQYFPNLKYVFYGAGSVQHFARPFLHSGVRVFSAWAANGVPVAEYTVAQIVLANKGYFRLCDRYKNGGWAQAVEYADHYPGNYGGKIGLLGAGVIGKNVIKLLKPYALSVRVYDPYLSAEGARTLGVEQVGLEEIFSECAVISNHIANNERTKGMLDYRLFSKMGDYATFINTGRHAQIVEADLLRAMMEKPTRTALLDVTDPTEPLPKDNPLWQCPNVFITPHRAGSVRDERYRLGAYMMEEYGRIGRGDAPLYEVVEEMLLTMA